MSDYYSATINPSSTEKLIHLSTEEPDTLWAPTNEQKARVKFVYDRRTEMKNKRDQSYIQFNDRTLKEFIDDSEKRMNAYVLSKESQGKEGWQANFATRAYANKTKALLAATARDVPGMKIKGVRQDDSYDYFAAEISENLLKHSYNQENVQEDLFFLAWSNVGHGTVLSYEGFDKQMFTKKRIKSFDLVTGDVDEEIIERASEGEPVSYEISLMNLLIGNFYVRDVQKQPEIILEKFYADKERFDADWGQYPNAKKVKNLSDLKTSDNDTYFHQNWSEACENGKGYYVCLYMNRYRNSGSGLYRIVANGVELFNGPMPWRAVSRRDFGRPVYPIAKTIYEPFANTDFFYGNSQPNSAMGEGDVLNTLYNSSLDKQYRSMVPPILVGMVNKDMLDLEDEVVAGDTKIYVEDINQVKQMEIRGISDSDVKMIDLISRGLDLTTLDPQQQGVPQKYVTARAAVAADERARQLKGIFTMFMESLWLQKMRLRLPNIILSYTQPKLVEVIGEEGAIKLVEKYRQFNVENTSLSDGSKGTLGIRFMKRDEIMSDKKAMRLDVEAEEERAAQEGKAFEKVVLPFGWLDHLSFDIEIIPETLWQSSQSLVMAMVVEKVTIVNKLFPEYYASNKELFFRDLVKAYGDDVNRYDLPPTMDFAQEQGLEMAKGMAGKGGAGGPGQIVSDLTGSKSGKRLADVTGE